MCGFSGFWERDARTDAGTLRRTVRDMALALYRRGPDDAGEWADEASGIALGFRRLAIVDLSEQGHQPMTSASQRFVIAFNGEVYNHEELRRELESAGMAPPFRGRSDTETMLAAIEAWGLKAAVERFAGMFAFALWDRKERSLHLVRDRLGIKPLYYGWARDAFLFGSELKALLRYPGFRPEIDRGALALFFRHNYVPAPYTIYQGMKKMAPGTILTLRAQGEVALSETYWSPRQAAEEGVANPLGFTPQECVKELDSLLREAIGQHMMADVPLGAFLSGGIDSSTVVALMQAQSSRPIKTFSIGFDDDRYNEARYAKAVAAHLGTEHTELILCPQDALAVVPDLPVCYDEPFSDSSQIPTLLVSKLARRHVTVSLSGDGGDELFGGYRRYAIGQSIWNRISRIPRPLRAAAGYALENISSKAWEGSIDALSGLLPKKIATPDPTSKMANLAQILRSNQPEAMYRALVSHWQDPLCLVEGAGVAEHATLLDNPCEWPKLPSFTESMMYLDLSTYLPDDILVKVDRASMAESLEARVPLLDHRVVEWAWRLPLSLKMREGQTKWPLRQVLYRYVPPELIERPKRGFAVPLGDWLRGPLRDWAEALLDPVRLSQEEYLNSGEVLSKWNEHISGRRNWQYHLWDVLMFQAWLGEQRRAVGEHPVLCEEAVRSA